MNTELILEFFKDYGLNLSLLALSGMVILGCLKWFGCFKKINATYKKYIYFGISCTLSIIACTIYILCTKAFAWGSYLVLCGAVIGFTLAVYGLYENTGLRAAWKRLVLNNIARLFKWLMAAIVKGALTKDKLKKMAIELGSETLSEMVAEAKTIEEQKRLDEEQKKAQAEIVSQ